MNRVVTVQRIFSRNLRVTGVSVSCVAASVSCVAALRACSRARVTRRRACGAVARSRACVAAAAVFHLGPRSAAIAAARAAANHVCGRGDAYGILRSGITTSGNSPMTGLTKWRNRMVACGFLRPRAVSGYRCGNYSVSRARCFLGVRPRAGR